MSFRVQLINMGTRAAAFQAKLRCLHDYHQRLLHNTVPLPSGSDIANTLKYFSQTLLTVLKDVRNSPLVMIKDPEMDQTRMASYPNLEYSNLYNAICMLIDVTPNIQYGISLFGKAILQVMGCILPFLDRDVIDNLPYLCASLFSVLPHLLYQDIINYLCYYILPFTITRQGDQESLICQSSASVSSVIMFVFHYSNNPAHHCQLLECLMSLKHNVVRDILCVIAYGTSTARSVAAKLLFYYWPAFDANLFDRKVLLVKYNNDLIPFVCQRDNCTSTGNAEASKVCYDHNVSILHSNENPPPLYCCIECANSIHREHPSIAFKDIVHPMAQVSMICENKNCRSSDKSAFSICFSTECISYNGNHPIRYCNQCHTNRHNAKRGVDHIYHRSLLPTWQMDLECTGYMIEAIVSLLREAKPLNLDLSKDSILTIEGRAHDNISNEDRQQLGKYGIWLLVGRCSPTVDTPIEILGRLLNMLFHWFHITAYTNEVGVESTLEKLKIDHVCGFLKEILKTHDKVFINCLLPHPPEYARVGGHWDTLASRTQHLKEGLQRLICLVPYEIITQEIWETVMPHWMESVTNDVPEKELSELKIVLRKILDPLGFDANKMYNFITIRFEKTTAKVQMQALHWLQVLTRLEILIPLNQLFTMFGDGVRIMKHGVQHEAMKDKNLKGDKQNVRDKDHLAQGAAPRRSSISPVVEDDSISDSAISDDEAPTNRPQEFSTDSENNLTCCILMLDILLKQMELQDIEQYQGINTHMCDNVCRLLKCMITATAGVKTMGPGSHVCSEKTDCLICEAFIMWHQLATKIIQFLAPKDPIRQPDPPPVIETFDDEKLVDTDKDHNKRDRDVSFSMAALPIPLGPLGGITSLADGGGNHLLIFAGPVAVQVPEQQPFSIGNVLMQMPHVCSIMTATVETVSDPLDLDLATMLPSEKIVTAVARSVTLSDADVAQATVQIAKPSIVGAEQDSAEIANISSDDSSDGDFWHTSVGKFKFCIEQLPQTLQFIHQLLTELPSIDKPEILYELTRCLNTLVLHGDAFTKAARDHRGFFIWCQENLLIKNLWELCNAENSNISQVSVPVLLHCITLPVGSDAFWKILQEFFQHSDWRVRFQAVERVTVIARFMDSTPLRSEINLQTALANAFCHLIASMDDINVYVAQRATLYLGTIHDTAIRSLLFCLESQFDTFIIDRPVVLQSVYQLLNSLSDRKILTWDFFLSRFDTLFIEAQVNLEKNGDLSYLRDLRNSENGSEILTNKICKAREALSQSSDSTESRKMSKTLSASFGKWQYKRTMSAPANFTPRQESKIEKEKIYNRQISAPLLKRKTSRFGLDGHISGYDEVNFSGSLFRVIDLEESTDKETIHLLTHLLMQFMSRPDLAFPTEEKPTCRLMSIVLKHVYLLMGFNQNEKMFQFSSSRIRCSSVFNSFMANLPQFLDQNVEMGSSDSLFNFIIHLLIYSPYPNNSIPATFDVMQNTSYSLWFLEPQVRKNWLMAVLVILYKYNLNNIPEPLLSSLIRIIMMSLESQSQFHQCKRIPTTILVQDSLRRPEIKEPTMEADDREPSAHSQIKPTATAQIRKPQDSSIECDETESELVAIPESDLSDSTIHGESIDDGMSDDHHATALKIESKKKIVEPVEDKKKASKTMVKSTSNELAAKSVSEGMRMMFSSAILSPPVNVQKAIVVTQPPSSKVVQTTCKDSSTAHHIIASATTSQLRTVSAVVGEKQQRATVVQPTTTSNGYGTSSVRRTNSPIRALGRQQRIIDTNGISHQSSISADDQKKFVASHIKTTERRNLFGSPESPLSRMDVLPLSPPETDADISTDGTETPVLTPTSVKLEFPTPERLLPIGNMVKENVNTLCDRVREGLAIPDISHLRSQDHLDKSTTDSPPNSSRATSPRRLIKQVALVESPPHVHMHDPEHPPSFKKAHGKCHDEHQRRVTTKRAGLGKSGDSRLRYAGSWAPQFLNEGSDDEDEGSNRTSCPNPETKQSVFRIGDECTADRCSECGALKEEYTDEELGLFIVLLGTFIHREPALACPFLPDILVFVSKMAHSHTFSWQYESSTHLPGASQAVAHQFIRCVLHQLAPNGIFYQIFLTQNPENVRQRFFKCVALALLDFAELHPASPVNLLMESLNNKKTLPLDLPIIMRNLNEYLLCLQIESLNAPVIWTTAIQGIDSLFRRIVFMLPSMDEIESLLSIMVSVFKMPGLPKSILEPFSKIFSYAVQNLHLNHKTVHELCCLNSRAYTKERDKYQLARQIAFELAQCLKFKTMIPDHNLLLLIGMIIQDLGGNLPKEVFAGLPENPPMFSNNTADCMRQYLNDILEFLADFHTLSKIKNFKNGSTMSSGAMGLTEDTLGGALKGAISQYLALEMSRGNSKENRAVARYLPWLYNAPTTLQQGPKEFTECVSHMRLLSWLLMGSLTHTAQTGNLRDHHHNHQTHFHMTQQNNSFSQPVPQDASCHIADYIQTIFAGFLEQSKTSILHMSSLFHAFTLCQLWTVYLEQISHHTNDTIATSILFEFWVKVTPTIFYLISHSKLNEMVNLHFLSLLEALKETRSTILSKLLPLWSPLLSCNNLSGTLQVRLQNCRDIAPNPEEVDIKANDALLKWLQRLQFKMAQIELQSSQATTQFYSL
ncbi:protein unc-79 homolog isoform X3 [Chironomus tepperi]|uniref:protein unc-79 homolog isoform X3 n=1 Tax=Chironomus tepperi TaxID=113505 RepID=UPI00391F8FF2